MMRTGMTLQGRPCAVVAKADRGPETVVSVCRLWANLHGAILSAGGMGVAGGT